MSTYWELHLAVVNTFQGILTDEKRKIQLATSSKPAVGTTQSLIQWAYGFFPGSKTAGTWSWPKIKIYCGIIERVKLCFTPLYIFKASRAKYLHAGSLAVLRFDDWAGRGFKFDICVTVHHWYNNINSQLDATITVFIDNYNQLNMFSGDNFAHP